jgi:hypothetical protein
MALAGADAAAVSRGGGQGSPRTTAPNSLTVNASSLVMPSQPQVVIDVIRKAVKAAQGVTAAA